MPRRIDPQTINVDELPGIWSPVQWELFEDERLEELENQATASLIWTVDTPEAILRLFLNETDIKRAYDPPSGYDPEIQGEWDTDLVTFQFMREITLVKVVREEDFLYVEYKVEDLGNWAIEIQTDIINIFHL
jgi:hypothetical protein